MTTGRKLSGARRSMCSMLSGDAASPARSQRPALATRCVFWAVSLVAVVLCFWVLSGMGEAARGVSLRGVDLRSVWAFIGALVQGVGVPLVTCAALAVVAGWSLDAALVGPGRAMRRWGRE